VPQDLKISGDEEIFTIRVHYETQQLYGKVTGTREVVICRE
jgi:hypothetical protein